MNTLLHLLSTEYLFHKSLGPFQSNLAYVFVGFCVFLIIIAIISRILAKKGDLFERKSARKYGSFAWTMGSIGVILYVFRQINVLYLSAPVLILVWGIIFVIWLIFVLRYRIFIVPNRRKNLMQETKKREYMP